MAGVQLVGLATSGLSWASSSIRGLWPGEGNGDRVRTWRSRAGLPFSAALGTPALQVGGGLWHTRGHPGFQGPRQGGPSFLLSEGKQVSDVWAGSPWRGGTVVPMFGAQCSA